MVICGQEVEFDRKVYEQIALLVSSVAPSGASFLLFSAIFVKESIFSQKYYIFQKHFWVLVLVSTRKKTSKYEIKVFADFSAQIKALEGSNLGEKAKIKYAVTFC